METHQIYLIFIAIALGEYYYNLFYKWVDGNSENWSVS